jgi:coproporphyrinogen III oxidase-like Fe-S oxidoreductase
MDRLKERLSFANDAEIAIEINRCRAIVEMRWLGWGVTRMSLRVQNLEQAVQKAIGREQT